MSRGIILVIATLVSLSVVCWAGWQSSWSLSPAEKLNRKYPVEIDFYVHRDKIGLEVEGSQGLKTASAVQEVKWKHMHGKGALPNLRGIKQRVKGEAVVLEVSPGRYLFALMKDAPGGGNFRDRDFYWGAMSEIFAPMAAKQIAQKKAPHRSKDPGVGIDGEYRIFLANKGRAFEIPKDFYPLLVTFDDIKDPKSVKRVDPDDLDGALGCSKSSKELKPWRAKGLLWREWYEGEQDRLARERAGKEAGLSSESIALILEYEALNQSSKRLTEVERKRRKILREKITNNPKMPSRFEEQAIRDELIDLEVLSFNLSRSGKELTDDQKARKKILEDKRSYWDSLRGGITAFGKKQNQKSGSSWPKISVIPLKIVFASKE